MSLVVAGLSSPPLKTPTANLLLALQDFDAILSDQQRLVFKSNYTKPDTTDVVAFVSRIDADNKSRAQKCVAPRLCSFLECAVQFTGVVDTFVQSNPAIAALVWGGLRTTILTASNYASYFEKVTDMIMKIGRTSPSYQKFGELYPSSAALQGALCEYYATVIRLCIKVIQVSQRSGIVQILSPVFNPFETDFKSILDRLSQNVREVDMQIALASHKADRDEDKLAEIERKDNRRHRHMMLRLNDDLRADADELRIQKTARQLNKARKAVNNALSMTDHVPGWRRAKRDHLPGTADWFLQDDQYVAWSTSSRTSLLWCSGKLGSGKTVLMSNIVAKLLDTRNRSDELVSYYFCRTDDLKTLTCRAIFGSICRQLLQNQLTTMATDELEAFAETLHNTTTQDLVELVLKRLDRSKIYFILLDGLDEFERSELVEVSQTLAQLCRHSDRHFRIVCSARLELQDNLFRLVKPDYHLNHSGYSVDEDIRMYISTTLTRCMKEADLVLGDDSLFDRIAEALRVGAHGMFLWARLIIDELCLCDSDAEISTALEQLPRELSHIYKRKMQRILSQKTSSQTLKILDFCYVARCPLTTEEMREALSVELGQKVLDRTKMPNDMTRAVSACCGLVYVDEQDETIRFLHHSVKQFLSDPGPEDSLCVQKDVVEKRFGLLCLTYLNFNDFERQVSRREPSALKVEPLDLALAATGPEHQISVRVAKRYLRWKNGQSTTKAEIEVRAMQSLAGLSRNDNDQESQYQFLRYAKDQFIYHVRELSPLEDDVWPLFCKFVERADIPWDWGDGRRSPLQDFIIEHDHAALTWHSVESLESAYMIGHFSTYNLTLLLVRASLKNKHKVRWALACHLMSGACFDSTTKDKDHESFVKDLLIVKDAVNGDHVKLSLLSVAFTNALASESAEFAAWLLSYDVNNHIAPDVPSLLSTCLEWPPSRIAATICARFPRAVERAIRSNPGLLDTAVHRYGSELALTFLEWCESSNRSSGQYTCDKLLLRAVRNGNLETTRALLRSGMDPNPLTRLRAELPVYDAIDNGDLFMLDLLLEYQPDLRSVELDEIEIEPLVLISQMKDDSFRTRIINDPSHAEIAVIEYAVKHDLCELVKKLIRQYGTARWPNATRVELARIAIRGIKPKMMEILIDDSLRHFFGWRLHFKRDRQELTELSEYYLPKVLEAIMRCPRSKRNLVLDVLFTQLDHWRDENSDVIEFVFSSFSEGLSHLDKIGLYEARERFTLNMQKQKQKQEQEQEQEQKSPPPPPPPPRPRPPSRPKPQPQPLHTIPSPRPTDLSWVEWQND